jgi:hypothetical protein
LPINCTSIHHSLQPCRLAAFHSFSEEFSLNDAEDLTTTHAAGPRPSRHATPYEWSEFYISCFKRAFRNWKEKYEQLEVSHEAVSEENGDYAVSVDKLVTENEALEKKNRRLKKKNQRLWRENAEMKARIAELEGQAPNGQQA